MQYCIDKGWAVNIEYTDDPHPRNTYWEMWDLPMFDIKDAAGVMLELDACRKAHSGRYYIRALGLRFLALAGRRLRISFIVDRPKVEPGFRLVRTEGAGRDQIYYTDRSYPTRVDKPEDPNATSD